VFFSLSSWALALLLIGAVVGATVIGLVAGGRLREKGESLRLGNSSSVRHNGRSIYDSL
jgi:hypothetical protein